MARPARRPRRETQIARLLVTLLAGLVVACASQGAPPGGPPDTKPPHIVQVKPESGTVVRSFSGDAEIQFDETVDEMATGGSSRAVGGLAGQVLLSPVSGPVRVDWHRSRVSVKPKEGWKTRVYRMEILPGFVDLRRNRSDSGKTVLFSTGPAIGHARIGGIALKWIEQSILLHALIEAVPLPDSAGYMTYADSGGQFDLENLAPGRYIVYALQDDNGDRRRNNREAYDSVAVTLDSSTNVALYTFPHDTTPPRPRAATNIDSLAIRVEFSQALDPTTSFDTAHVHVLELPDSTPVPVAQVLTERVYDSVTAAARVKADSAAAAARDTTRDTTKVAPPRIHPTVPPTPLPGPTAQAAGRPARRPAVADSTRPHVDTTLVRQLLARRPIPSDKIVVQMGRALKPATRYVVRVQGATNLIAKKGDGEIGFSMPKPTPADTSHAPAAHPARPPRTPP